MGKLQTKEAECDYKGYDRELTKQFIHGLDNKGMISKEFEGGVSIGRH